MKKIILASIITLLFSLPTVAQTKDSKKAPKETKQTTQKIQKTQKTTKTTTKTSTSKKVVSAPTIMIAQDIKYVIFNYETGKILEQNSPEESWPIASLTKLMTAHVFMENHPDIKNCHMQITEEDKDFIKNTGTRLSKNKEYSCEKLLEVMLISSDNYAASALARSIPGWSKQDFVAKMNLTAKRWNAGNTRFVDSSGLSPNNYSNAKDYANIVMHIVKNKDISIISSSTETFAVTRNNQLTTFRNSSKLVREFGYQANLSKTGYIRESGYNLVHLADCQNPIGIVEFGAKSSEQRARFAKQKLNNYGCFAS